MEDRKGGLMGYLYPSMPREYSGVNADEAIM